MNITVGKWKTRGGRKAIVGAKNDQALASEVLIGWINGVSYSWREDGSYYGPADENDLDLIEPLIEPVPWDWSTTPTWINWIAMDPNREWWMYREEPILDESKWNGQGGTCHMIPKSHAPQWIESWKLSKTMRPGYKK